MLPLFVYGTLKHGESNYVPYLAGRTTLEQPATIFGAVLYTDGKYPFLVVDSGLTSPSDHICGMLMTIHPLLYDEVMRRVDDLEDYAPGNPGNWYERTVQTVQTAGGNVEAWVYVAGARVMSSINKGEFARITSRLWSQK